MICSKLTEVRSEGSNGGWVTAMDRIDDGIQVIVIQHLNESLHSMPKQCLGAVSRLKASDYISRAHLR